MPDDTENTRSGANLSLPVLRLRGAFDASAGTPGAVAWPDGFDDFVEVGSSKDDKNRTPAWLPVTLREGGRRVDADVLLIHALVLDYDVDDQGLSAEDILARWDGYERVLHSTWTPGRWRVILPYARPHTPLEHATVYAWVLNREKRLVDSSCRNPSRLFFWPCVQRGLDVEPVFGYEKGELLDVRRVSPASDLRGAASPVSSSGSPSFAYQTSSIGTTSREPGGSRAEESRARPDAAGAVASPYAGVTEAGQDRDLDLIESRCAFAARARDMAATLPEPEWYAALSVWARCRNGDALAHQRSQPHPGYSPPDTDAKLARAKAVGPATCAYVRTISPACAGCALQVTSPVLLGRVEPEAAAPDADPQAALRDAEEALVGAEAERRKALWSLEQARRQRRLLRAPTAVASEDDLRAAIEAEADAETRLRVAERTWKAREKDVARIKQKLSATGLPPGADPLVWQRLRLGPDGRPVDSVANVVNVLDGKGWASRLSFDAFTLDVLLDGKVLPEEHVPRLAVKLAGDYGLETTTTRLTECIRTVAVEAQHHPVQEWLRSLRWDGVPRAGRLVFDGFGVVGLDKDWHYELLARMSEKFLVSMVARAMKPGCKMDTMLILTGPQGALKSTALKALVPKDSWYGSTKLDLHSKDSYMALRGKWVYEMAELSAMRKAEANVSKGWLSNEVDNYRAPYARVAKDHPRHCVTPGSDNDGEFLMDPTGSRRQWPVPVRRCNPDWIAEHREQLFAEALVLFERGTLWWFDQTEKAAEWLDAWSAPYVVTHPWTETVVAWLRQTAKQQRPVNLPTASFTATDVLVRALGKDVGSLTGQDQHWVSGILRQLSCTRLPRALDGGRAVTHFGYPEWLIRDLEAAPPGLRLVEPPINIQGQVDNKEGHG